MNDADEMTVTGGKWEDEEERRFFEDLQDLKDFVPSSVLGLDNMVEEESDNDNDKVKERIDREKEEVRKLEEELQKLDQDIPPDSFPNSDPDAGIDDEE